MSDQDRYLDTFPTWLRTLGEDAQKLADALGDDGLSAGAKEALAGGLNYLFKSLDLIPDGIDDIGYLDDAFVLRVAVEHALRAGGDADAERLAGVTALGNEAELVRGFLDANYERLETYVKGLVRGSARGRSVADVVGDATVRAALLSDVRGFASSYEVPSFAREEKNLIKLRAFFDAKLPR